MARFFTQYWSNPTYKLHAESDWESHLFYHTAGERFTRRGVKEGDSIYGVTILKGRLYLLGKMKIGEIIYSDDEAAQKLDYDPYPASEHLFAELCTPMTFDNEVPIEVTKGLKFRTAQGYNGLKFVSEDHLDTQTLRSIRQLHSMSAEKLDAYLEEPATP